MQDNGLRRRTISRAAEAVGGMAALGKYLRVSADTATDWAAGAHPVPDFIFLKAVDLLLDYASVEELSDLGEIGFDPAYIAQRAKIVSSKQNNEE
jgi:hypothetical protein